MATDTSVMAVIRASRPSFRSAHDKIAFAVHASFVAAGYSLTATGNRAFSESATDSSSEEVGIDGWNDFDDGYGFIYTKTDKGSKESVIVKCLVMGWNLVIDALRHGDEQAEPLNLQINIHDFISEEGSRSTNYVEMYKNFPALVDHLQSGVLNKLENKPKHESTSTSRSEASRKSEGLEKQNRLSVLREPEPYPSSVVYPPVLPVGIDDLHPGPGAGFYPSRGSGVGGGMLVGPNDPRWHGGVGGVQPGFLGGVQGVPPGARFDPYGPPGIPGFEPQRFARNPRRPGGGTHPDMENFPGHDDYYL